MHLCRRVVYHLPRGLPWSHYWLLSQSQNTSTHSVQVDHLNTCLNLLTKLYASRLNTKAKAFAPHAPKIRQIYIYVYLHASHMQIISCVHDTRPFESE